MLSQKHAVMTLFLISSSCALSESERCAGELIWDDKVKLCRAETVVDTETRNQNDAGEEETSADASPPDAGETQATFGTPCSDDNECTGEVDLCLKNPLSPEDPGVCTIQNCAPGDCPNAFQCCDCSSLGAEIACMPEADVSTAEMFGCSCY